MEDKSWIGSAFAWVCIIGFIGLVVYSNRDHVSCTTESIPFTTQTVDDDSMDIGDSKTVQDGVDGVRRVCSHSNGDADDISIITQPVDEIVHDGSKLDIVYDAPTYSTPPTTCNDGTYSYSTGRGTCSWHGGINHYNY